MPFLSGSIAFERFRVAADQRQRFGPEHIEILQQFASGQIQTSSTENVHVGFLAGGHLFDHDFDLEKNVINDALHCAVRIDTNQIPSAIRKAWLQMELAALTADNPGSRPTKTQRQEAKEAVEQRCEDEARTGKYHKMQQFPLLWDARQDLLYFGGSSASASELCGDLFARAFDIELERLTAGKLAVQWADQTGQRAALEETNPAEFHPLQPGSDIAWLNNDSGNFDFLGNEFLLWLWWHLDTQSDTISLADGSEVVAMFARTLSLECPRGESGKETITAECPVRLPEAVQAIRSGKLPRKAGLTLVREGQQYELTLQSETFAMNGAKVQVDEDADGPALENRIDAIRSLGETVDLLFQAFCVRRIGKAWGGDLKRLRHWLQADTSASKKPAA